MSRDRARRQPRANRVARGRLCAINKSVARTGRPKLDDPRSHQLLVRLNEEESAKLDRICRDLGLTRQDWMRMMLERTDDAITKGGDPFPHLPEATKPKKRKRMKGAA